MGKMSRSKEIDKWKAESDMHTLMQACEIKKDKARMDKVRALAKEKLIELASVAGGDKDE